MFSSGGPPPLTPVIGLYDGAVAAVAPHEYCIDTTASNAQTGFAVMVACDAITKANTRPDLNGVVIVQVGQTGTATVAQDPDALQKFLGSTAGENLLSATGTAETVTVHAFKQVSGAVTLSFRDQAAPPVAGLQTTEWRAFVDLKGRLMTIAVRGLAAQPLSQIEGQTLLENALETMLTNNFSTLGATDS